MFYSLTDVPGGRWAWEEVPRYNLKSFCELGIKLVQVDVAFDHVWGPDGHIAVDTVQRQLKAVHDVCPDAAVFIRFHVNPPKWWQQQHPEENTVYADTKPMPDIGWGIQRIIEDDEENPTRHSLASERWKTEATEKLKQFLSLLKALPEANSLAGIQVAGGVYGEWHYWGFIENEPDLSLPMQQYFRQWLTQKYKTDKSLQQSWGGNATLANATVPSLEQRRQTLHGVFRDPVKERNVIDYYEAQQDVVVDDILLFCKVIKDNWPRPIVTGAFYGYFYAVFGREAAGGHLQLQRLLKSKDIDFLCGPGTYYPSAVEMGDPYRSRSLINSVSLHGKMWLDEMDQQTPLVPLKDPTYKESLQKSIAQVRRNVLFTFSKGQGLWFYDFGPSGFNGGQRLKDHGTWGWWDEPTLRNDIKTLKGVLDKQYHIPLKSVADVLLVHDTKSFYYLGSSRDHSSVAHRANNWIPVGIFKTSVVHDVIHIDDLPLVNLDQYKAVVFVNTFVMSREERAVIKNKVAKNGRHLFWIYAPGYSDGGSLDQKFIEEVTGMRMSMLQSTEAPNVTIDSSIVKNYTFSLNKPAVSNPVFVVTDSKAQSYGTITKTTQVALASKQLKESTSWFLSLPYDRAELWSFLLTKAGAHRYCSGGEIVYAWEGMLSIHSKAGGRIEVALRSGKRVTLEMPPNATWLVDDETGEVAYK
ncbi:MAG: hypothetical protein QM762_23530 [Chryseolinea sp.]